MRKEYLLIIAIILLFYSCSSSKEYSRLFEPYKNLNEQAEVGIYLDKSTLQILNEEDLRDDFGEGRSKDVYFNLFRENVGKNIKKHGNCSNVNFIDTVNKRDFTEEVFDLVDKIKIKLPVPEENKKFEFDNFSADYIIFIDNLVIGKGKLDDNFLQLSYDLTNEDKLYAKGEYIIWDNKKGEIAGYGKLRTETTFLFLDMEKNTWLQSFDQIAQYLVKRSPFNKMNR